MRRLTVLLGMMLLLGAVGALSYRWVHEPGRYARHQPSSPGSWRSPSEPRAGGWRDDRPGPSAGRSSRNGGLSSLRLFEIVIDLLNVVVGVVGIWLAVVGVRMQRSAKRQISLRTDA